MTRNVVPKVLNVSLVKDHPVAARVTGPSGHLVMDLAEAVNGQKLGMTPVLKAPSPKSRKKNVNQ